MMEIRRFACSEFKVREARHAPAEGGVEAMVGGAFSWEISGIVSGRISDRKKTSIPVVKKTEM